MVRRDAADPSNDLGSNATNSIENRSLPSVPQHTKPNAKRTLSAPSEMMRPTHVYTSVVRPHKQEIGTKNQGKSESFITPSNIVFSSIAPKIQNNFADSSNASETSDNIANLCNKLQQMQSIMHFKGSKDNMPTYSRLESVCSTEELHELETQNIFLHKLFPKEREFHELIETDNVEDVRIFLKKYPSFNINCVNYQGISALHIALHNRSEPMVEFLLKQPNIDIGDTILHAARNNETRILLTLLEAQKKISPGLEFTGVTHSPIFPEFVTPVAAAAQAGNYDAILLLLSRGHIIDLPHVPCSSCKDCSVFHEDPLYTSKARLYLYRAYSSPEYLVHVCADPILAAFRLAAEMKQNAATHRHFSEAYMQINKDISKFAVDLLGCCRTTEEVELLLKQTNGFNGRRYALPRLLMAIDYKQKEFVVHPSIQQVLEAHWCGESKWHKKSFVTKAITIVIRVFITPLILIMSMIAPWHRVVKEWQTPLNKMITHVSAYFVFLYIVFFISNQDKSQQNRGPPNTGLEGVLLLYVCGYVWSSLRKCLMHGTRRYFSKMWNWTEIIMLALYIVTFVLWLESANHVNSNTFQERKYWYQYDPTLLAEGTFCIATIIAFLRLMFLCQLDYHLGPLQVSLGKMINDIYKYIIVYTIILSAFAAGLSRFYQYYKGMVHQDKNGMKAVQVSSFTSISDTLYTLFWGLFCMTPLESADVVLDNTEDLPKYPLEREPQIYSNQHGYTQKIGYFCFGTFEVISVIIVLNMLIATMSNTFQKVTDNNLTEWTFARTEVYLEYMRQTTLPSPYNLIPTAGGVASIFDWCRYKLFPKPDTRSRCSFPYCCYLERDLEANIQKEYPTLMSMLLQRYFRMKCTKPNRDLHAMQREIAALKTVIKKINEE